METMAACHAALGQTEASREWQEHARLAPITGDALRPLWRHNPQWASKMQGGLRST